jgi:hypothetical protein
MGPLFLFAYLGIAGASGLPAGIVAQMRAAPGPALVGVTGQDPFAIAEKLTTALAGRPIQVQVLPGPDPLAALEAELARQGLACGYLVEARPDGTTTLRTRGDCAARITAPAPSVARHAPPPPAPTPPRPPRRPPRPREAPPPSTVVVSLARLDLGRQTGLTWDPGPDFELRVDDHTGLGIGAVIRGPTWLGIGLDARARYYPWGFDHWGYFEGSVEIAALLSAWDAEMGASFGLGVGSGCRFSLPRRPGTRLTPILDLGTNLHALGLGAYSSWLGLGLGFQLAFGLGF